MNKVVSVLSVVVLAIVMNVAGAHEHKAPHKGTLVAFGEEFAHLELVIDQVTGKVSAYVLDGEAEKPIRITQADIELKVLKGGAVMHGFNVKVTAVANELSGEKVGDTSEFAGQSDKLKQLKEFDANVVVITVKGKEFKDVKFNFPKGNE